MTASAFLILHAQVSWLYTSFVFFSTLALYNFPVLIPENFSAESSERHQWVRAHKKPLSALFLFSSSVSGILLFFFSPEFSLWFAPVALLALAYFFPQTQLRGIAGIKTLIVAFVWTCTTAVFPLLLKSGFDLHAFSGSNVTILLQNFLFIFPLCLLFNVRDIEEDRRVGVRTLPVIYGVKFTVLICQFFLAFFAALVFFSPSLKEVRTGLLLSGLLSAILILFASEKRSDIYYTLWVDGMILLQAILLACHF